MNKRSRIIAKIFEKQVRQLKDDGVSVSKIAKLLGGTYNHTKNIYDRISANETQP